MISNKDLRVEGSNLIINGEKHPLDPAVDALIKRANTVQGKLSALDTKITAIEALEKTASGNPISLTGAAEAYATALNMTIEPIQSGSGDPSPTNVRPISGLTSGEVQTTNGTDTNTATIAFGQTVYSGTVNFKTGEVTVTHGMVDLGTLDWTYPTPYFNALSPLDSKANVIGGIDALCSAYTIYRGTTFSGFTNTNYSLMVNNKSGGNTRAIYCMNTDYTDTAALKTAMSGVQLCYELATPTTLTLTPAELELLKGENTISGNGVTINISYLGR